jgi:hypothetical protein
MNTGIEGEVQVMNRIERLVIQEQELVPPGTVCFSSGRRALLVTSARHGNVFNRGMLSSNNTGPALGTDAWMAMAEVQYA